MRKRKWWIAGLALALLAALWWCILPIIFSNRFASVPDSIDQRLLGKWTGLFKTGTPMAVTFRADGTARASGIYGTNALVWWGTRDGVLCLKFRSAGEGYVYEEHPYVLTSNGKAVEFQNRRSFIVVPSMRRVELSGGKP